MHTTDFEYWASEDLRVSGVLINSKVNDRGWVWISGLDMATPQAKPFLVEWVIWYFDEKIDLSDMGYLWRNDYAMFSGRYRMEAT